MWVVRVLLEITGKVTGGGRGEGGGAWVVELVCGGGGGWCGRVGRAEVVREGREGGFGGWVGGWTQGHSSKVWPRP